MEYIFTKEQFLAAKTAWAATSTHSAADHIIYNVIRGVDPKRGFSEITNTNKLNNGATAWQGYKLVLDPVQRMLAPPWSSKNIPAYKQRLDSLGNRFGIEITLELAEKMREVLK